MELSRLTKRETPPAPLVDESGKGFWTGQYTELPSIGCQGHWKEPEAWKLFYVTVNAASGEIREGFVRAVSAQSRSEAVIALARHYAGSGLSLILHDCIPPLSRETVISLEICNGKIEAERSDKKQVAREQPKPTPDGRRGLGLRHQQKRLLFAARGRAVSNGV